MQGQRGGSGPVNAREEQQGLDYLEAMCRISYGLGSRGRGGQELVGLWWGQHFLGLTRDSLCTDPRPDL